MSSDKQFDGSTESARHDRSIQRAAGRVTDEVSLQDRLRLLESAERVGKIGAWEWSLRPDRLQWSANVYRIFGVEPGDITPMPEFVLERTHPEDRDRVARHIELTRLAAWRPPIEYRITHPDRRVYYLRETITMIQSDLDGPKRISGAIQDITDQLPADRELAAHAAVSGVLADWDGFEESGKRLLSGLAQALQFEFGALWIPNGEVLSARLAWSNPSVDVSEFETATRALSFPRGVGFPGRAWERKAPVSVIDVLEDPSYRRRKPAADAGLHGAAAFPVLNSGNVLAVVELYTREPLQPSARVTQTMIAIGNELGEFLSRRQGQLLDAAPLTPRELQVLQLAADGLSRSQIADHLTVSSATIATHMKHIFESLGSRDRASAVATAIRLGLID